VSGPCTRTNHQPHNCGRRRPISHHTSHISAAKLAGPTSFLASNSNYVNRATAAVLTETGTVPLHCSRPAGPSPKRVKAASAEGQTQGRSAGRMYLSSSSESKRPFRWAWMELWDGIVASVEIPATTVGVTSRCLVAPPCSNGDVPSNPIRRHIQVGTWVALMKRPGINRSATPQFRPDGYSNRAPARLASQLSKKGRNLTGTCERNCPSLFLYPCPREDFWFSRTLRSPGPRRPGAIISLGPTCSLLATGDGPTPLVGCLHTDASVSVLTLGRCWQN
jgi:hypothetical protein